MTEDELILSLCREAGEEGAEKKLVKNFREKYRDQSELRKASLGLTVIPVPNRVDINLLKALSTYHASTFVKALNRSLSPFWACGCTIYLFHG